MEIANASMAWEIITQGKNKNRKTDIGNPSLEEYFTKFCNIIPSMMLKDDNVGLVLKLQVVIILLITENQKMKMRLRII